MKRFMRRFSKVGWGIPSAPILGSRVPASGCAGVKRFMRRFSKVGWGIPSAPILGAGFRPLDVLG